MDPHPNDRPRGKGVPRTKAARKVEPHVHDAYRRERKVKDAVVCDHCGVVCHGGRWYWGAPPLAVEAGGLCPACERIRDRCPAGTVRLISLPGQMHDEIIHMIRNVEQREKHEHPLERLIEIDDRGSTITVTTTGMHLARCIGGALRRRFHGGVTIHYPEDDDFVRVDWSG